MSRKSLEQRTPDAKARIPDYAAKDKDNFLGYLKDFPCLLIASQRGNHASARQHFLDLEISPNVWAIAASLTGIHCNALTRQDFDRLAGVRAGMVWSPLSNLMLYGQTADIKAARAAGVRNRTRIGLVAERQQDCYTNSGRCGWWMPCRGSVSPIATSWQWRPLLRQACCGGTAISARSSRGNTPIWCW